VTTFDYADESLQRVSEDVAFTFADFVAADPRHADHVARVPRGAWSAYMVPVADWLARPASGEHEVPYLLAVDSEDSLQRLVVDDRLVKATRRCLENWHRLQELGGVHSSHAERLLARERAAWEAQKREEIEALKAAAGGAAAVAAPVEAAPAPKAEAPAPAEAEAEPERNPDEAWIETIRCSSCNECIQINDQMFAYNDNKQAYIKDLGAGTYQQLVEAAESCQIGIIHPGKPVNPKEPGLEELMERAKPFL
jgi:ferredoxin